MKLTFKQWLNEENSSLDQGKQASQMIQQAIQEIHPQQVTSAIKHLGIDPEGFKDPQALIGNFDKLTQALENSPKIKHVVAHYKKMKMQAMGESVVNEGIWDIITTLAQPIVYIAKKSLETISYVLQPIPGVGRMLSKAFAPWREIEKGIGDKGRVEYTGMLLLTFLLSPMLLGIGVATANPGAIAAGMSTAGYSLSWWIYMLAGKSILEPILKAFPT